MKTMNDIINGSEISSSLSEYEVALSEFYRAFNNADTQLMQTNWLQSEEASLANPLGGLRRGWSEIFPLYEKLFNGPAEVYVEYFDYTIQHNDYIFLAVGRERGYFRYDNNEVTLAIRTSRTYKKTDQGWRQLHHHGSIEDPELLQSYQSVVIDMAAANK